MRALDGWAALRDRIARNRWSLPLLIAVAVAAGATMAQPQQSPASCTAETENLANAIIVWEHAERWLEGKHEEFMNAAELQMLAAGEAFMACRK